MIAATTSGTEPHVPQFHEQAADVPKLVKDRIRDVGLSLVLAVSHTDHCLGRQSIASPKC